MFGLRCVEQLTNPIVILVAILNTLFRSHGHYRFELFCSFLAADGRRMLGHWVQWSEWNWLVDVQQTILTFLEPIADGLPFVQTHVVYN